MLEHLFGSKTRVKLMTLFLNHPEESYFIRELTRLIGTQINAVRREIDNLAKMGLIIASEAVDEGEAGKVKRPGLKRKYYRANPRFPLLSEIQALMSKSNFLMERHLDKEIASLGNVSYLAFMGSFLGKTAPVDLFVVGTVDMEKLKKLVQRTEHEFGFEVNFTCLSPGEFKYRKDIADRFLTSVLNSPKHTVIDQLDRISDSVKL